MEFFLMFALLFLGASSSPTSVRELKPEHLEAMLKDEKYEEFAYLMGIDNVDLVRPGNNKNPFFNEGVPLGDVIEIPAKIEKEEVDRQVIRFERHPGSKWRMQAIPYLTFGFDRNEQDVIDRATKRWNEQHNCLRLVPRTTESDFVIIFPGNGCWSFLGRTGGPQPMSLQRNGCLYQPIILHEFQHAAGIHHEHNRSDRDEYVQVLWENIPERWKPQYYKNDEINFDLKSRYDYYSIMHYPVQAPETGKPAFQIKKNGVNEDRIGRAYDFTEEDKEKLRLLYCNNT